MYAYTFVLCKSTAQTSWTLQMMMFKKKLTKHDQIGDPFGTLVTGLP